MSQHSEYVTPSEAAVIADVAVRDVHRVIDEQIIPEPFYSMRDGRRLLLSACPLVSFYFHASGALTSEERIVVIGTVADRVRSEELDGLFRGDREWSTRGATWAVRDRFLTVDLAEFIAGTYQRWRRLLAARRSVVQDPEILGGMPVLRGTRVPVHDVAASLTAGVPRERLRQAYGLDDEAIELADLYARAMPHRGRRRTIESAPASARLVATRRVRRQRRE
jgi:uncharacterized protein (DUF433 family)